MCWHRGTSGRKGAVRGERPVQAKGKSILQGGMELAAPPAQLGR